MTGVPLTGPIKQPLSLITLDIMLPVMDGWEFLTRLKLVPALGELHYNIDWRRNNWTYLQQESYRALKAAGDNPASGVAYNARAARRSWRCMQEFFREIWRVNE